MISVGQQHKLTEGGIEIGTIEVVGITPTEFYFTVEIDAGFNKELSEGGPIFTCPIPEGTIDFHSPYVALEEGDKIKFKVIKKNTTTE